MGRDALARFVGDEEAARVEHEYRRRDIELLASQSETGDLHASQDMMFRPDNPIASEESDPAPAPAVTAP